jgi:NlpC/P60 family putative phage cell wall peptidase
VTTRGEIVAEAREWIGTPFMHQQTMKGVGVDCMGLVRGVCRERGLRPSAEKIMSAGHRYHGYSRVPDGVRLKEFCDHFMVEIPLQSIQPADVLLMQYTGDPQHCAIVGDYRHGGLSIIHAISVGPRHDVREHRLTDAWRKRVVVAYAIPGVC